MRSGRPRCGEGTGLLLVVAVLVFPSCTVDERYAVLSFIFDGVPEPGEDPSRARRVERKDGTRSAVPRVQPLFFHEPYRKRECNRCHPNEKLSIVRLGREPGFCFRCHEHAPFRGRLNKYRHLHGPVAVENCLACHRPHNSRYPHLGVAPDPYLCYRCHSRRNIISRPAHQDWSEEKCLTCHNPHGGQDRFFLREEGGT